MLKTRDAILQDTKDQLLKDQDHMKKLIIRTAEFFFFNVGSMAFSSCSHFGKSISVKHFVRSLQQISIAHSRFLKIWPVAYRLEHEITTLPIFLEDIEEFIL